MSYNARSRIGWIIIGILFVTSSAFPQSEVIPKRIVKNNVIISDSLPRISVAVNGSFKYLGRFPFKIRDVAAGERFVFVDEKKGKVKRMFIAQFEGFLPHIDDFYRYSFENAETFGAHKFRHNTYAYSNKESRENNPKGESALTAEFLKEKGYILEDELMMSRFITVPQENKKHELILYYFENVSETKNRISDFYN
ncbi:MAG: hypothetical protein KDB79_06965, partial [Acidobacteria bacterium]|nr:hypothetical protein [Acidobacteriota bacterium]